jgi:hypothetical protein
MNERERDWGGSFFCLTLKPEVFVSALLFSLRMFLWHQWQYVEPDLYIPLSHFPLFLPVTDFPLICRILGLQLDFINFIKGTNISKEIRRWPSRLEHLGCRASEGERVDLLRKKYSQKGSLMKPCQPETLCGRAC